MTFYNVISALLFLGAVRGLLDALEKLQWEQALMAVSLTALVFNDMLSTSYEIESGESHAKKYTFELMLIDLTNFLLLAMATIVVNPVANVFDVKLPRLASFFGEPGF